MKPKAYDIYCGLGGWTEGLLATGWRVTGFDIEPQPAYPGEFIQRDVLDIHGGELADADLIVASPPCQEFSYRAMPWKRAKALGPPVDGINLFWQCWRIQQEASEAKGEYIPMVVENVRGAEKWVGGARWHYGSYYLWGDVPAIMPFTGSAQKVNPDGTNHGQGSWFKIADSVNRGARKVPGLNWSGHSKPGYVARAFNDTAVARFGWRDSVMDKGTSKGIARKAASAQIAKIPYPLAEHIGRVFLPQLKSQAVAT
jgi:hypothetical protein